MRLKKTIAALLAVSLAVGGTQMYVNAALTDGEISEDVTAAVETAEVPINESDGDIPVEAGEERSENAPLAEEVTAEASDTWEANFVYDESTGVLAWDKYPDAVVYDVFITNDIHQTQFGGTVNDIANPNTCLAILLAYMDLYNDGFTGNITVSVEAITENLRISSTDSFSIYYDGCDVDEQLSAPTNLRNMGVDRQSLMWDDVDGAVGYLLMGQTSSEVIYHCGKLGTGNIVPGFADGQEVIISSVTPGGDRSEWSAPCTYKRIEWKPEYNFDEDSGILSFNDCEDFSGAGAEIRLYGIAADGLYGDCYGHWSFSTDTASYKLPVILMAAQCSSFKEFVTECDEPETGRYYIDVMLESDSDPDICVSTRVEPYSFSYDGCDVNDQLTVPEGLSVDTKNQTVTWNEVDGAIGYLVQTSNWSVNLLDKSGQLTEDLLGFVGFATGNSIGFSCGENWEAFGKTLDFTVCAIDINGDRSEWSEAVTISPGAWTEETAGFVYDESTGVLSWGNRAEDMEGNYNVIRYEVFANGVKIGTADVYETSYDHTPSINLPMELAYYNCQNEDKLNGELKITVKISDSGICSPDSFTYTFNGGKTDPAFTVPQIESVKTELNEGSLQQGYIAYRLDVELKEFAEDAITYFIKVYDENESYLEMGDYQEWANAVIYWWVKLPERKEINIEICSVDINGNMSEWSEPYTFINENILWKANFVYDEETGVLSWDHCADAVAMAEYGIGYDVYVGWGTTMSKRIGSSWYFKNSDGSFNKCSFPLAVHSAVSGLERINYVIYAKVASIDGISIKDKTYATNDNYTYEFKGGEVDSQLSAPKIKDAKVIVDLHDYLIKFTVGDITEKARGVLLKIVTVKDGVQSSFVDPLVWVSEDTVWEDIPGERVSYYYDSVDIPDEILLQVCAVDKYGNTGEWSEPYTITNIIETERWEANFTFDEKTGNLTWDNYTDPEEGGEIGYTVSIAGYGDNYFELNASGISVNSNGTITKPSVNLPYSIAEAVFARDMTNVYRPADLKNDYTVKVTVDQPNTNIISSDSFTYTFMGEYQNPETEVPQIKNVRVLSDGTLKAELNSVPNAIGLLCKVYNDNFSVYESWLYPDYSKIYISCPDIPLNTEFYVQVSAVDVKGNTSVWSESFPVTATPGKIDADGYCVHEFTAEEAEVPISENVYTSDIMIPGVVYHETTVGELKEICKGIIVKGFEFEGSSLEDITADDIFFGIIVQTDDKGSVWGGWNALYDSLKMTFEDGITVSDSEIVRGTMFQCGLKEEAIKRLGLKPEDRVTLYFKTDGGFVYEGNTFTFEENMDGLTITGGTITNPDVVIPAEIDGKPVTEIGMNAFDFNSEIETLVIPENVKRIKWYAFNTCQKLTKVTLPDSLEFIDSWAFEHCNNLKEITVPKNTSFVGGGAFAQNYSMISVNCDPENKFYVSADGVLFTKDMKELTAYPAGKSGAYTVPNSVNHIGDAAFYGAKKLTAVEISGTLDFIGFEAFAECELLTDVVINDGVDYVGYWAFRGCNGIKQLTVPQSVTNIGDKAFGFADYDNKAEGFSLKGYKNSAVYYYALRHDIPFVIIGDAEGENSPFKEENAVEEKVEANPSAKEEDSIVSITINPAFNMKNKNEAGAGIDLSKIKVKACEIYDDEESIKRAEEALGEAISGNKHYNLLDLTLLYGGNDFSNGYDGLVEVIIPIPAGHRDKEFYCYRIVDNNGTPEKELIPGKRVEGSYIVYLEHFSVYAFVGDGDHEHSFRESWESDGNEHWHECSCGERIDAASHTASEPITENGIKYTECTVCQRRLSEEDVSGKPSEPSVPSEPSLGSGSFTVPETSDSSNSSESTPDNTESSGGNTAVSEAPISNGGDTPSEVPSNEEQRGEANKENGMILDNAENTDNQIGGASEDKNMNTGVTVAVIPAALAAAVIIFSRKRK